MEGWQVGLTVVLLSPFSLGITHKSIHSTSLLHLKFNLDICAVATLLQPKLIDEEKFGRSDFFIENFIEYYACPKQEDGLIKCTRLCLCVYVLACTHFWGVGGVYGLNLGQRKHLVDGCSPTQRPQSDGCSHPSSSYPLWTSVLTPFLYQRILFAIKGRRTRNTKCEEVISILNF